MRHSGMHISPLRNKRFGKCLGGDRIHGAIDGMPGRLRRFPPPSYTDVNGRLEGCFDPLYLAVLRSGLFRRA